MKISPASSFRLASLALAFLCASSLAAQPWGVPAAAPNAPAAQTPSSPPQRAGGEQQTSAPTVTMRQTVRRVILDVMVRDAAGKPVQGLTAGDFSVREDRAPQRILTFDVYNFDNPSISRGPNARPLPPNFFENIPAVPERGPLYVILDDMVNTETEDQLVSRQQILKFIRSKPAGTRFAIFVACDQLTLVQGFTDDKDLLYAALDPNHPKPHVPKVFLYGANYGKGDPYTALDMLTHVGQYLDGIPGRKNLIWVSGRFDVSLFPRAEDPIDLQNEIRTEINALAQAQVAVFPLNARGVVLNPEGALTGARPNGGAVNQSENPGGVDPAASMSPAAMGDNPVVQEMQAAGQGDSLYNDYLTQDAVAMATGGRAFYSANDLADALNNATEDGGNYYTLTYSPPNQEDDNQCHNIAVTVAKAKYQLSYRRYYCRVPLVSSAADESEVASGRLPLAIPLQAGDVQPGETFTRGAGERNFDSGWCSRPS
jgi:VWFA-related protein